MFDPGGVISRGTLVVDARDADEGRLIYHGVARSAISEQPGEDLERIEDAGRMAGARPEQVSERAKVRQQDEMGTLGSGNHYLEVQEVSDIHDPDTASSFGLAKGNIVISIHCGSRGLGHQVGLLGVIDLVVAGIGGAGAVGVVGRQQHLERKRRLSHEMAPKRSHRS